MSNKHEMLDALTRIELLELVDRFGVRVVDKRVRDTLVQGLAQSPRVELVKALEGFSHDRLRELCRFQGIDDSGRTKAVLLKRLTGVSEEPLSEPDLTPPIARSGQTDGVLPFKNFKAALLDAHLPRYLERLLEGMEGNVTKAAQAAGISRTHLKNLMRRYRVGPADE